MPRYDAPVLSENVSDTDWVRDRLSPWESRLITSIIPTGFDAYARILHPVQLPRDGDALVRWADVSKWSGVEMHPQIQWHEVALPEAIPSTGRPWRGQGPRQGSLFSADAEALIEDLSAFTSTREECFFGLWIGYFGGFSFGPTWLPSNVSSRYGAAQEVARIAPQGIRNVRRCP